MNSKTSIFFALSLAMILSVSLVAAGDITQATADKNDRGKVEFNKHPDFKSESCITTQHALDNLSEEALNSLDCKMIAWLDKEGKALKYKIIIDGMELLDSDGNTKDTINQLHIHHNTLGTEDDPRGPHQLNVFGAPSFDDREVVVKPVKGTISGFWDDGDENLSFGEPNNSHTLTENLEFLCDGKVFSAIHGDAEDRPGHKAPYLKMILEPNEQADKICESIAN